MPAELQFYKAAPVENVVLGDVTSLGPDGLGFTARGI